MSFITFLKNLFGLNKKNEEVKKVEKPTTKIEKVEVKESTKEESTKESSVKEIKSKVKKTKREPKFKASKAAIKLAKENGIDLTKVKGSGKDGSIIKSDVEKIIK